MGSRSETLKRVLLVTSAACYAKKLLSELLYKQATVNFHAEWFKHGDVTLLHCAALTMYCTGAHVFASLVQVWWGWAPVALVPKEA
jgi:hypothetical protein